MSNEILEITREINGSLQAAITEANLDITVSISKSPEWEKEGIASLRKLVASVRTLSDWAEQELSRYENHQP